MTRPSRAICSRRFGRTRKVTSAAFASASRPPKYPPMPPAPRTGASRLLDAELPEDERVVEGELAQAVVAAAAPAVARGIHVDVEEERVGVRLHRAHLRHVFR